MFVLFSYLHLCLSLNKSLFLSVFSLFISVFLYFFVCVAREIRVGSSRTKRLGMLWLYLQKTTKKLNMALAFILYAHNGHLAIALFYLDEPG